MRGLFEKRHGLDAGDLKPLAATHVLAHKHVVFADHIGTRLGELGLVALVGAAGELLPLGSHEPRNLVVASLAAMRAGQVVRLLLLSLVVKIALFHKNQWLVDSGRW